MTVLVRIFSAFVAFTLAQGEYQTSIDGMQGLLIFGDTTEKRDFLSSYEGLPGFDFIKLTRETDIPIEVLVAADQLGQFKSDLNETDIQYEVFIEDVSKIIEESLTLQNRARKLRANNVFKAFPRYTEVKSYLKSIAEQYNHIAQTVNIGKSYEGRDILALKISYGSHVEKPVVIFDAGIHAREWIAPTTALYAIRQLVENSTNHYLFEDVDIYVIPLLNPDGYEYSHQNVQTRIWRKTRSNHVSSASCRGVDANRNFDMEWRSSSAYPCSDIYSGPRPFSEPETAALRDLMLSFNGRVKTYVTLHSFGQYILHPWGYTRIPPKSERQLKCIAEVAAYELYKHRGKRYTVGSITDLLYPAFGGSIDWAVAKAGAEISYALELPGGRYGFAPPPSEIVPVGRETFDALAVFIQYAKGVRIC